MCSESLMVVIPIVMPLDFDVTRNFAAYLLSITALIVFPFSYLVSNLSLKYSERRLIFLSIVICMISSFLLINFTGLSVSLIRFIIFFSILFVACNILESLDSVLLAKMFPSNLNLGIVNSGFMIILTTSGGRFLGSLLITVLGSFVEINIVFDYLMIFYFICFLVVAFTIFLNYDNLRVKAINRILRLDTYDKKHD